MSLFRIADIPLQSFAATSTSLRENEVNPCNNFGEDQLILRGIFWEDHPSREDTVINQVINLTDTTTTTSTTTAAAAAAAAAAATATTTINIFIELQDLFLRICQIRNEC